MVKSLVCWNCGNSLDDVPRPISRHAYCSGCFEVLYCCRMCIHFKPVYHGQCDHERAEPPVAKETANFCDFFRPARNAFEQKIDGRKHVARSELAALFGEDTESDQVDSPGQPDPNADTRNKLDDLFNN